MDEQKRLKLDKNYRRIRSLERRFPFVRRITQHPKIGPWVPVVVAIGLVAGELFLAGIVATLLALLWSYIPWPRIDISLPNLQLPRIPLPHLSLPNIPDLPAWAKDIIYWISKTWPIWIATLFAVHEIRKKK